MIAQAVVHPTLFSVIPVARSTVPEITGTYGRRTAASYHGCRTSPRCGAYNGDDWWIRIGSCTEEEMKVMDLLEMMEIVEREEKMGRVEREDD